MRYRDFAYALNQDAPLDLTLQSLASGTHVNLGKAMFVESGSLCFWFYGSVCVGIADVLLVTPREGNTLQVWTGSMRAMTQEQRRRARALETPGRGGVYVPELAR